MLICYGNDRGSLRYQDVTYLRSDIRVFPVQYTSGLFWRFVRPFVHSQSTGCEQHEILVPNDAIILSSDGVIICLGAHGY